jgi:hypothetical protein
MNNATNIAAEQLSKPIKDTKDILSQKLMSLEETGPTAMGPALLTAIALAA